MESIMQQDRGTCYLCGKPPYWTKNGIYNGLEAHHVFGGANRKNSEKYGLKVYLHGSSCHRDGKDSAHQSKATRMMLQAIAQKRFEKTHGGREEFVEIFGKNYL